MSNVVHTPEPRPAPPRPTMKPPPLKTDAMEPLDLFAAYAANPPMRPPPLPPPPARTSSRPASLLPIPLLPPRPSRVKLLGKNARKLAAKAATRTKEKLASLEVRRRATAALAWTRARATTSAAKVAPAMRAAMVPRFSVLTLVLVLVAAWGGAFAASLGTRMQRAPATTTAAPSQPLTLAH